MNRRSAIKLLSTLAAGLMVRLPEQEWAALEQQTGTIPENYLPFLDEYGNPTTIVKTQTHRLRLVLEGNDGRDHLFYFGPDNEVGNFVGVIWDGDPAVRPRLQPMQPVS